MAVAPTESSKNVCHIIDLKVLQTLWKPKYEVATLTNPASFSSTGTLVIVLI